MNLLNQTLNYYYSVRIRNRLIWVFVLLYSPKLLLAQKSVQAAISGADTTITLHVGGILDAINTRKYQHESIFRYAGSGVENNVSLSLENKGSKDIVNPRIEINGKRMVYKMADLIDQIPLNHLSTIDDTVKTIWYFLSNNYCHWLVSTEAGTYQIKPVKTFNIYGAGQCENAAQVICSILRYLGYQHVSPVALNAYHTVGLLSVNGRSIILDADLKTFYTKRDNRSLVDLDSVIWDRELATRQHHGGLETQEIVLDDEIALGYTDLKRTGYLNNYQDWANPDSMLLRIRPGEQIVFNYDFPVGNYFSYYHVASVYNSDRPVPPNSSLGIVKYKPRFCSAWLNSVSYSENAECRDAIINSLDPGKTTSLVIDFKNSYVWTNGKLAISYSKSSKGILKISARKDYQNDYTLLYEADSLFTGARTDSISLFEFLKPNNYPYRGEPMTNLYYLKIEWLAEGPKGIRIDSLYFENNFQLNPNALPRLNLGENTINITNQSGEPFEGLIYSHAYKEINDYSVRVPPEHPLFPIDGGVVNSSQFEFGWELPTGIASNDISDFNIQVSEYPDFCFPVSPAFNKLTSQQHNGNVPKWRIPHPGLLNSNTSYYWRVAVRNSHGVWSDWSKTWSFTVDAAGTPLNPFYVKEGDSIVLKWTANPVGQKPVKFYILASNERGFSYNDSLIIDSTENSFYTIKNSSKILDYAFYRIAASDINNLKTGVSDLIAIEDILLCDDVPSIVQSSDSLKIKLGRIEPVDFYGRSEGLAHAVQRVSDSLIITPVLLPKGLTLEHNIIKGKVSSPGDSIIEITGRTYLSGKTISKRMKFTLNITPEIVELTRSVTRADSNFHAQIIANDPDGDRLIYSSGNLPQWMTLDSLSGVLSGTPSSNDAGDFLINVCVKDDNGGKAKSNFRITVWAPSPYFSIQSVDDTVCVVGQPSVITTGVARVSGYSNQIIYRLRGGPDWLKIDPLKGKMYGTPPLDDYGKDFQVRVRALDTSRFYSDYIFSIHVTRKNTKPQFLTLPDTVCYYGTSYKYQVNAVDVDTLFGDKVVKYVLLKAPHWLAMDSTGSLAGVVNEDISNNNEVVVGAIDAFGDTSLQAFTLYVPQDFVLHQNYPNPFSRATSIPFELPYRSYVKIEIFNLAGQKMGVLAQGAFGAGYHRISWNAAGNTMGVYFVVATINRLTDDKKIRLVRRMLLVK